MKFGKKLRASTLKWGGITIEVYKELKKVIGTICQQQQKEVKQLPSAAAAKESEEAFFAIMNRALADTGAIYQRKMGELQAGVKQLEEGTGSKGDGASSGGPSTTTALRLCLAELKQFMFYQKEAARKLVKKLDKKTGSLHLPGFVRGLLQSSGFLWGGELASVEQRLDVIADLASAVTAADSDPSASGEEQKGEGDDEQPEKGEEEEKGEKGKGDGKDGDDDEQQQQFASPEDEALLDTWNDVAAEYPSEKCLQDLFWEQAKKTPAALALVDGDRVRLTYAELDDVTDR